MADGGDVLARYEATTLRSRALSARHATGAIVTGTVRGAVVSVDAVAGDEGGATRWGRCVLLLRGSAD